MIHSECLKGFRFMLNKSSEGSTTYCGGRPFIETFASAFIKMLLKPFSSEIFSGTVHIEAAFRDDRAWLRIGPGSCASSNPFQPVYHQQNALRQL